MHPENDGKFSPRGCSTTAGKDPGENVTRENSGKRYHDVTDKWEKTDKNCALIRELKKSGLGLDMYKKALTPN